jgi:hypothetical protein
LASHGKCSGSVAVAWGIIREAEKVWSLTTLLVVGGVAVEAICTLLLFGFDEGLSSKQQTTIEVQRDQIISLERQIAPCRFSPDDQKYFGSWLSSFKGRSVRVTSYMLDFEAAFFGQEIIQGLREGGIMPVSSLLCDAPIGAIVVGVHVCGRDTDLVNAILADLTALSTTRATARRPQLCPARTKAAGYGWEDRQAAQCRPMMSTPPYSWPQNSLRNNWHSRRLNWRAAFKIRPNLALSGHSRHLFESCDPELEPVEARPKREGVQCYEEADRVPDLIPWQCQSAPELGAHHRSS